MFNESSRKHLGIVTQIYADMRLGLVWQRYSDTGYPTLFTWIYPGPVAHSVTWWEVRSSCQGTPRGFPILSCEKWMRCWLWFLNLTDEQKKVHRAHETDDTLAELGLVAHASCPQFGGKLRDHWWENCCVSFRRLNESWYWVATKISVEIHRQIKCHNIRLVFNRQWVTTMN